MPNANIFQHKHENLEGFTVESKTATFALGASESGVIDLEGYQLAAFYMPAAWDAAVISFLSAPTADGAFEPVYADGIEVTRASCGR